MIEQKQPIQLNSKVDIFIAYAQEDENLKLELEKHLSISKRLGGISTMDFAQILPGADRNKQIAEMVEKAEIILLLISPNFLNQDMLWDIAIKQIKNKNKVLLPILAKPVFWENSPLTQFQALPLNLKAVTSSSWKNKDEAWMNVTIGITNVVQQIKLGIKPTAIKVEPPKTKTIEIYQDILKRIQNDNLEKYVKRQKKYRVYSRILLFTSIIIGTYKLSPFGLLFILFLSLISIIGIVIINALSQIVIWKKNIRKKWFYGGLTVSIFFIALSSFYHLKLNEYAIQFSLVDGNKINFWTVVGSNFKDDLDPEISILVKNENDLETILRKVGGLGEKDKLYDMSEINQREIYLGILFSLALISFSLSILFLTELIILPPKKEQLESLI